MKHFLTALLIAGSTAAWSQSLPFDFESATSRMVGYDNATFTIVNGSEVIRLVKH